MTGGRASGPRTQHADQQVTLHERLSDITREVVRREAEQCGCWRCVGIRFITDTSFGGE